MKKISFLHATFFLVIGIFLGNFILPRLTEKSNQPQMHIEDGWRTKLQALTDEDISDYYRLKSLEDRYKKADEILGKIMTIFLADLGIRVSKTTLVLAKQGIITPPLQDQSRQHSKAVEPTLRAKSTNKAIEQSMTEKWIVAERLRDEVRSDGDVSDFLEKVKIGNFDEALKSSATYKNRTNTLDVLRGNFKGTVQVKISEKSHDWDVDLLLDAEVDGATLKGTAQTKLAENGRVFSSQSDKGDIRSYREFTSGSNAVLVKVAPTTYFQLYYLKELDALAGNIYERNSDDESFDCIGALHLTRSR